MCVYIYIYTYIHVCIYIYTRTRSYSPNTNLHEYHAEPQNLHLFSGAEPGSATALALKAHRGVYSAILMGSGFRVLGSFGV